MSLLDKMKEHLKIQDWKLKLANAILEENPDIIIGEEIENQLGTVWVGKYAISAQELADDEEQ